MSTDEKIKRGPGRPRLRRLKPQPPRLGVLDKPNDDKNCVEMLYDKPSNFNKICKYWKSLNADKIRFLFTQDALVLYTKNYKGTNDTAIRCEGALMTQYHCTQPLVVGISFANIELILNKLDKSYETISFVIKQKTQNKTLHIILHNEVNIPEFFEIDIFIDQDIQRDMPDMFVTEEYPLEFSLPGKYFKKMISDTRQFNRVWALEMYGLGNLMFTYKSGNGQVKATVMPKSMSDISLKSTIKAHEIFSVSVYIDTLKPTSSSQLADVIHIKAAKDRPLCITADLDDKAITVVVLIQIVDHRCKPEV